MPQSPRFPHCTHVAHLTCLHPKSFRPLGYIVMSRVVRMAQTEVGPTEEVRTEGQRPRHLLLCVAYLWRKEAPFLQGSQQSLVP